MRKCNSSLIHAIPFALFAQCSFSRSNLSGVQSDGEHFFSKNIFPIPISHSICHSTESHHTRSAFADHHQPIHKFYRHFALLFMGFRADAVLSSYRYFLTRFVRSFTSSLTENCGLTRCESGTKNERHGSIKF